MPSLPANAPLWLVVIWGLLGAGGLNYARDWLKARSISRSTPQPVKEAVAAPSATEASLSIVARARDELEEDNARLRAELAEERANAQVLRETLYRERNDWATREGRYLTRIEHLENSVNALRDEIHLLRSEIQGERRRGEGT